MFEIEKNIQPPYLREKYPFQVMEVGDCFVVEGAIANAARAASAAYGKRHSKKFVSRMVECGQVRIWRVE